MFQFDKVKEVPLVKYTALKPPGFGDAFLFLAQQYNQPNAHFLFQLSDRIHFPSKASIPGPLSVSYDGYLLTSFPDESLSMLHQ